MTPQGQRLELDGVGVAVGERPLFSDLNLELAAGEIVALQAPSGSGKTTLLRAVAALIDPSAGRVLLDGRTPEEIGYTTFRRRVGYLSQQPVHPPGTLGQSLERPFGYGVSDRSFPRDEARSLLGTVRLGVEHLDQEASSLSVGEQQRGAIVRALLVRPDVLLLDEPTSALDEDTVVEVENVISRELCARGGCALVVSHNTAQIDRWCDRAVDLTRFAGRGRA